MIVRAAGVSFMHVIYTANDKVAHAHRYVDDPTL